MMLCSPSGKKRILNKFESEHWKPPKYATGPKFVSEICSGSTFFDLWEVVQIFQKESIFCSKISSGGSLFISFGGNQFWGSPFLP